MTGQQLTMKVHRVIVVEKSECFELKLLETSGRIVTVIQCRISRTPIGKDKEILNVPSFKHVQGTRLSTSTIYAVDNQARTYHF